MELTSKTRPLYDKWVLWAHLPHDTNWAMNSYIKIMEITTLEDIVELYNVIPTKMFHNCMFFLMKDGIKPRWEDPLNKNGGCFSYKINNVDTIKIWKTISYCLVGRTITPHKKYYPNINGITLSPKKSFHICKIWMSNCLIQDPNIFEIDLDKFTKKGCIFKRHK